LSGADLATFRRVAGDRPPPGKRVKELSCVCARRSGKSRVAAALATYLALFEKHRLARGETGHVLTLAPTADQARTVFQYCNGFIDGSEPLRREVVSTTAHEIKLRNNAVIGVHACSHRSVRGRTLLAVIADETAFWRDETSATPDVEVYRAVMPSLVASGGMLVGISTPYRRLGLLYAKHRDHFGHASDDILVVQGDSATFNPTLSSALIESHRASDPEAAISEWERAVPHRYRSVFVR
jgi:phage terminase large subunit-like protein